jgi:DNA polymerase III gamma/tau subunit
LSAAFSAVVLDQKKIHQDYEEGNFDAVIKNVEAFLASNKSHSREDSVFVAKHLAVVYSANPQTREKGKWYMYRLLELLPSAKLVDMYVSDEIDRIFEKVREEFAYRQKSFGVDSTQMNIPQQAPATANKQGAAPSTKTAATPVSAPAPKAKTRAKESETNWTPYWVAAGAAVVGVTAYLIVASGDEQTAEDKVFVIPAN